MRSARCMRSRCPFVTGSNVPANTARFMSLLFDCASRLGGAVERDRRRGIRPLDRELEWRRSLHDGALAPFVHDEPSAFGPFPPRQTLEPAMTRASRVGWIEKDEIERAGQPRRQLEPREIVLVDTRLRFEAQLRQV